VIHLLLLRDQRRWKELLTAAENWEPHGLYEFEAELLRAAALEALERDDEALAIYDRLAAVRGSRSQHGTTKWVEAAIERRDSLAARHGAASGAVGAAPGSDSARPSAAPVGRLRPDMRRETARRPTSGSLRPLWCETGQHVWHRPPRRGWVPASCPEHQPGNAQGGVHTERWIGDVKTCFLLAQGWTVRIPVEPELLASHAWPVPMAVGKALGLDASATVPLEAADGSSGQTLVVSNRGGACSVVGIAEGLARMDPAAGDLAFLSFRDGRYSLSLRRRIELRDDDALGHLLWSCGMDPSDPNHRRDAWHRLARAVSASSPTRYEIRRRFETRRDPELARQLDAAAVRGTVRGWPSGWQYTCRMVDEADALTLLGPDGRRRVAVGVIDTSGRGDDALIVTDGGLAWIEVDCDANVSIADRSRSVSGLVAAAKKPGWNRWMRAEHRLRLVGLTGGSFCMVRDGDGWASEDVRRSPLDLLERLQPITGQPVDPPGHAVIHPYPRSSFVFERILSSAESRGLATLSADPGSGMRAVYDDGMAATGSSFLDVLSPDAHRHTPATRI
jgi:hypothetical protein